MMARWTAAVTGGLVMLFALSGCSGGRHASTIKCWDAQAHRAVESCDCEGKDSNCAPTGQGWFCDPYGACQQACASDTECGSSRVCDFGACADVTCSAAEECGADELCLGGRCGVPPPPTACVVEPRRPVVDEGGTAKLTAVGLGAAGEISPTLPGDWSWRLTDGAGARVEGGVVTGLGAPGSGEATAIITATHRSGAACSVAVRSFSRYASLERMRSLVVDAESGRPVANATIAASDPVTGEIVGSGITGPDGVATLKAPLGSSLTVFAPDHDWVTLTHVAREDLFFAVRHTPPGGAGGFKGSFTTYGPDGAASSSVPQVDLRLGLAASSIAGSPLELDLNGLLGPQIPTEIALVGHTMAIPSGIALGLGADWYTSVTATRAPDGGGDGTFGAVAVPGECPDDALEEAGACGVRTAWALAGTVATQTALDALSAGDPSRLAAGAIITNLLPYFERFRSVVQTNVLFAARAFEVVLNPTAARPLELPPFSNAVAFPSVTAGFSDRSRFQRPSLNPYVAIPRLPRADVSCAHLPCGTDASDAAFGYFQGVVVLAGAYVPSQGLVGLGLTAAADQASPTDAPDGIVADASTSGLAPGVLSVHLAPTHSGIDGNPYVLLALAVFFDGPGSSGGGGRKATTGLLRIVDGAITRHATLSPGDAFLGFADNVVVSTADRSLTHPTADALPDATLRVRIAGSAGGAWFVYHRGGSGLLAKLPDPGDVQVAGDRLVPAPGGSLTIESQAMVLRDSDGRALGADDLFDMDGSHVDREILWVTAFSSIAMP